MSKISIVVTVTESNRSLSDSIELKTADWSNLEKSREVLDELLNCVSIADTVAALRDRIDAGEESESEGIHHTGS